MKSSKRVFNKCFCDGSYTKSFPDISAKTNSSDNGSDVPTTHIPWFDKSSAPKSAPLPLQETSPSRLGEECVWITLMGGVGVAHVWGWTVGRGLHGGDDFMMVLLFEGNISPRKQEAESRRGSRRTHKVALGHFGPSATRFPSSPSRQVVLLVDHKPRFRDGLLPLGD